MLKHDKDSSAMLQLTMLEFINFFETIFMTKGRPKIREIVTKTSLNCTLFPPVFSRFWTILLSYMELMVIYDI